MRRSWFLLLALSACKPYASWEGEFDAGPADPINYPPAYLGTAGDRAKAAAGSFTELAAYVAGRKIGYYAFQFSSASNNSSVKPAPDPLAVTVNGAPVDTLAAPRTYVFDSEPDDLFSGPPRCTTPDNYKYDQRLEDVPRDRQDNIFTALPTASYAMGKSPTWAYQPVVSEVPVSSKDVLCQGMKSEETLKKTIGNLEPTGRLLAWPIIDTGAAVYRVGQTSSNSNGTGVQHYGWYNHYLVAYLDGGVIPTVATTKDGVETVRMRTQRLFYPRSMVTTIVKGAPVSANGAQGAGYDVLEASRGSAAYTPVCALYTYDLGATPVAVEDLPKDADTITETYGTTLKPAGYVFCIQVDQ